VRLGHVDSDNPWLTVVGVVGDVRQRLETEPYPMLYFPLEGDESRALLLKTALPPAGLMPAVRSAVQVVDPNIPISQLQTFEERIDRSVAQPRVRTVLTSALAGLAAVLCVVGIFGVLAYAVVQRTNEIGIRMALGAETVDVVSGVLKRSLGFLGLGIALGLGVTLAAVRAIEDFLFDVEPVDPATLISVALLLAVAAIAASYIPARRATKVDPVEALRRE
jgi:ABC-type antimicrobial peptide transport system permease subunit